MAHLYRIGAAVLLALAVLLLLLPRQASAYAAVSTASYSIGGGAGFSSPTASCSAYVSGLTDPDWASVAVASVVPTQCQFRVTYHNGIVNDNFRVTITQGAVLSCSAGGVLSGSSCVCPAGQTDTGSACTGTSTVDEDAACKSSAVTTSGVLGANQGDVPGYVPDGGSVCAQTPGSSSSRGCKAVFVKELGWGTGAGQMSRGRWERVTTGSDLGCDGGVAAPTSPGGTTSVPITSSTAPTPVPNACNGTKAMFGGVEVCVPFKDSGVPTQSEKMKTESSTNSSGSPVSVITSEKTNCTGTSCTTEKTVSTSVGGGVATSETTTTSQGKGSYCASNGSAAECKGEGTGAFGGTCVAGFKCDGDALMCAVAKEQHTRNCELFVTTNAESDRYEEAKTKTGNQSGSETVAISASSFDQTNALGVTASCMPDLAITVVGFAVSLPFSTLCSYMQYLGYLNLGISFLVAMLIVTRG